MNKYEDLSRLEELRERGAISEEEYKRERAKILDAPYGTQKMLGMDMNTYLMLMHLSQLAGFIIPGMGFVAPIVMWLINKDNQEIDYHGKNIANFMLSMFIYAIASGVLILVLIGIPMLLAIVVMQIVFVIMAAVKASSGQYWKYPLAIPFFT